MSVVVVLWRTPHKKQMCIAVNMMKFSVRRSNIFGRSLSQVSVLCNSQRENCYVSHFAVTN